MRGRSLWIGAGVAFATLCGAAGATADETVKETPAPKTVEAARGPFVVVVEIPGVFDPVGEAEVSYEPKAYGGELEVVDAVRGGPVEKDQVLVRFSTEKIDEQIDVAARDVEIAGRVLDRQREEAKRAKDASDANLREAALERERAERELSRFVESERAIRTRESELDLKRVEDSITDQEEENAQLEEMYGKGDAVERTEEIVMKRARRQLERMRIGAGFRRTRHKWFVEVELADDQKRLELGVAKQTLHFERLTATASASLEQGRLELAKAEANFARQRKALADLQQDRAALELKAPRAGLAIPGAWSKGKWHGVDETTKALRKDGRLKAKVPVFTVIEPGAVALRATVPEARVLALKPGQPAEVVPAADEKRPFVAKVAWIAPAAGEAGFAVHLDVEQRDARYLPGFTAKVRVRVREAADVITLPEGAVAVDGERRVVHVVGADGTAARREVKLGDASDGRVEVVEGLTPGEKVLEAAPK